MATVTAWGRTIDMWGVTSAEEMVERMRAAGLNASLTSNGECDPGPDPDQPTMATVTTLEALPDGWLCIAPDRWALEGTGCHVSRSALNDPERLYAWNVYGEGRCGHAPSLRDAMRAAEVAAGLRPADACGDVECVRCEWLARPGAADGAAPADRAADANTLATLDGGYTPEMKAALVEAQMRYATLTTDDILRAVATMPKPRCECGATEALAMVSFDGTMQCEPCYAAEAKRAEETYRKHNALHTMLPSSIAPVVYSDAGHDLRTPAGRMERAMEMHAEGASPEAIREVLHPLAPRGFRQEYAINGERVAIVGKPLTKDDVLRAAMALPERDEPLVAVALPGSWLHDEWVRTNGGRDADGPPRRLPTADELAAAPPRAFDTHSVAPSTCGRCSRVTWNRSGRCDGCDRG